MNEAKQDIVDAAIRLAEDGRAFYLEAASKTANDLTRKAFESLAADETNHIEWIRRNAGEPSGADVENREVYAPLRGIFADAPDELRRRACLASDIGAIDIAIAMEKKSADQYAKSLGEIDNPSLKELFRMLVDVEKFHQRLLENTKEYLDHTADWFMMEEQWNFEGA